MDSKELVELRNLIATAQLPWRAALCDVVRDDPNDDEPWTVAHCGPGEGMEAVIVGAVNALPSLLDHIAAQDARIEALEGAWNDMLALLEDAPELNPSNYDHDQVCFLNNQMIQAWQLAHSMHSGEAALCR